MKLVALVGALLGTVVLVVMAVVSIIIDIVRSRFTCCSEAPDRGSQGYATRAGGTGRGARLSACG